MLLILTGVHFLAVALLVVIESRGADGLLLAGGHTPVGGDYVNLWTVGRLLLEGRLADVYNPDLFMAYQADVIGTFIGFRLWAYPPHSLLLAWPFGLFSYAVGLVAWSILGLATLWWGARRLGLATELTIILVLSPAALMCAFLGQSGNLMVGLLLGALAGGRASTAPAVVAATILSIKPQLGVLLPLAWVAERRWKRIVLTALGVLAAGALVTWGAGLGVWRDYLSLTVPALARFEREGTGPFIYMIPSVFMAARIMLEDGNKALALHAIVVLPLFAFLVLRVLRSTVEAHRGALVVLGTSLLIPYIHVYDLTLVLAGAMFALPGRGVRALGASEHVGTWVERSILLAWSLPYITVLGNAAAIPAAPLILLLVFLVADRELGGRWPWKL